MDFRQQLNRFYNSSDWIKLRELIKEEQNGICQRCGELGTDCHHKTYITPQNIGDIDITLNKDNIELLCYTCHRKEHDNKKIKQYREDITFDSNGNIVKITDENKHLIKYNKQGNRYIDI